MEFTDRYKALGIPYPDPKTVCEGDCEGTGRVPINGDDLECAIYRGLWEEAERENPAKDGWHFVLCPTCGGSGRKPA